MFAHLYLFCCCHNLVAVLAPFVVLLVQVLYFIVVSQSFLLYTDASRFPYLGEVDVGNDNNVDGAGSVLGLDAGVTTGVVLVLALAGVVLPGHTGDTDGLLGCGLGRGAAW